jgi:hypothetical protein
VRLPDPQRSRAVLIGTGKYTDKKLPDLPVVRRTIDDLAAALTDPDHGVFTKNHCTVPRDRQVSGFGSGGVACAGCLV